MITNTLERYYILRASSDNSGKATIYLRAYVNGQTALLGTTGVKIDPKKNWCKKSNTIKNPDNDLDIANLSEKLESCKYVLNEIVKYHNKQDILLDKQTLVNEFERAVRNKYKFEGKHNISVLKLIDNFIISIEGVKAKNTTIDYVNKRKKLELYFTEMNIPHYVSKWDRAFVNDFKEWLIKYHNNSDSSANKYIAKFRKVFDFAVETGRININPISEIKTPQPYNTDLLHLNSEWVRKLYNFKFHSNCLNKIRDMYVFGCETGIAHIDILNLTTNNIKNGNHNGKEFEYISGKRKKTGTEYNVNIYERANEIIRKYGSIDKLPHVSNQKCNQYIKDCLDIIQYPQFADITFHSARKSFAHNYMNGPRQVSELDMSKMLGHSNLKELSAYAIKDKQQILSKYID